MEQPEYMKFLNSFFAKVGKEARSLWKENLPDLRLLISNIASRGDCKVRPDMKDYSFIVYPANSVVIFHLDFNYVPSLFGFEINLRYFHGAQIRKLTLFDDSYDRINRWIVSPSDIYNVHAAIDYLISDLNRISAIWWEIGEKDITSYLTQAKKVWEANLIPVQTLAAKISQREDCMVEFDEAENSFRIFLNHHDKDFCLDFKYDPLCMGFEARLYYKYDDINRYWILFTDYNLIGNSWWYVSPTDFLHHHPIFDFLLRALHIISLKPTGWKKEALRTQILQSLINNKLISLRKKNLFDIKSLNDSVNRWGKVKIVKKSLSHLFQTTLEVADSNWEESLNNFLAFYESHSASIQTLIKIKAKITLVKDAGSIAERPFDSVNPNYDSLALKEGDVTEVTSIIFRNLPMQYRTVQKIVGVSNYDNLPMNMSITSDTFVMKEEVLEPEKIDLNLIPTEVYLKAALEDVFPVGCEILKTANPAECSISLCVAENLRLQIIWKKRDDFIKSYPHLLNFHNADVAKFLRENPYSLI